MLSDVKTDLKILAKGKSKKDTDQLKGKLFEQLITRILSHKGIQIDQYSNVNYAGMEIDIEGKYEIGEIPIFVECKYYSKDIDCSKLRVFFANYMAKWLENEKSIGIFIGIPGINSHARGFFKQYIENKKKICCELIEKQEVLNLLFKDHTLVDLKFLENWCKKNKKFGIPGDRELIFTENGFFWIQFIIPDENFIASKYILFRADGGIVNDETDMNFILELYSNLKSYELINLSRDLPLNLENINDIEQIVEVQQGSAPFEYQFPSSPKYFVGRNKVIEDVSIFVRDVILKKTSSRGLLFRANSGYGKSSLVLKCASELEKKGHITIAIDSRSASTPMFILKTFEYIFKNHTKFSNFFETTEKPKRISGINGLIDILINLSKKLEDKEKILMIFFDQFENIFNFPNILETVRNVFFKICDLKTNIIIGFSWKLDQIGFLSEFPYKMRDDISNSCKSIEISIFSKNEINQVINKLGEILHIKIRNDLRFLISDYSQGYPWLLVKLCAHVKNKRESGTKQIDLFTKGLNVKELFEEDMHCLSPSEEEILRRIAKQVPITIAELADIASTNQIESFVNQRLIVKIGNKYDLYWDIFRDYLNNGIIPIKEHYILRMSVGSIYNAVRTLNNQNKTLKIDDFIEISKISEKTYLNLSYHLKLLEIIEIENGQIKLKIDSRYKEEELQKIFQKHIKEKLSKNIVVQNIIKRLEYKEKLNLEEIINILKISSPYITAREDTWRNYAITLLSWIDCSNLGYLDEYDWILYRNIIKGKVRDFRFIRRIKGHGQHGKKSPSYSIQPQIQFNAIYNVVQKIYNGINNSTEIDWTNVKPRTKEKALRALEDFEFIELKKTSIEILPKFRKFNGDKKTFSKIFLESALKLKIFKKFTEIINDDSKFYIKEEIGELLIKQLNLKWKPSTRDYELKILFNWAKNLDILPERYINYKKKNKINNMSSKFQTKLF